MAQEYASSQPAGYKNQVQNIAIVGVRYSSRYYYAQV
jgi:hypothetical protein